MLRFAQAKETHDFQCDYVSFLCIFFTQLQKTGSQAVCAIGGGGGACHPCDQAGPAIQPHVRHPNNQPKQLGPGKHFYEVNLFLPIQK